MEREKRRQKKEKQGFCLSLYRPHIGSRIYLCPDENGYFNRWEVEYLKSNRADWSYHIIEVNSPETTKTPASRVTIQKLRDAALEWEREQRQKKREKEKIDLNELISLLGTPYQFRVNEQVNSAHLNLTEYTGELQIVVLRTNKKAHIREAMDLITRSGTDTLQLILGSDASIPLELLSAEHFARIRRLTIQVLSPQRQKLRHTQFHF